MHNNGLSRRSLIALSAGISTVAAGRAAQRTDGYVDILRPPDFATAFLENETITLARDAHRWTAKGIAVEAEPHGSGMPVRIQAPEAALMRVRLRCTRQENHSKRTKSHRAGEP